jgi:signal transduction histidine kinase
LDLYPINWLHAVWAAVIAILLTLAAMNVLLAGRRRGEAARGHLLFAVLAVAAAGTGVFELMTASARTADQYGTLLQAAHIPVGILVLVVPWVVLFLFRVGRPWLAVLANLVWGAALLLNLFQPHSRVYREITRVERLQLFSGGEFTWVAGPGQPSRWLGYLGVMVTLVFVVDAAIGLARRGELRRGWIVGIGMGASLGIGLFHSALVEAGAIQSPYFVSVAFLFLMGGIASELIYDAARVPALERKVEVQEAEVAHLSRQSMLREMSVGIAHELSQPISGILNNAQAALSFLDRDPPDLDEVREALVEIGDQDRHAAEVVGSFARLLKAGERQSELVDLNEVVKEVLELGRADLEELGVRASSQLAAGAPAVRGDRVLLSMVLLNLIRNAAEAVTASPAPDRRVTIRTALEKGGVEVVVTDLGPGISEDDREKVFEPFYTTRSDGFGLGLAVCRTLTELHGGSIRASAGPGNRGTSMHVRLPASDGTLL